MDTVKNHWPKIAVGVAAAGLAYLYLSSSSKQKVSQLVDISREQETVDGKTWPAARRIVNPNATPFAQKEQFQRWLEMVLGTYIKKRGSFKVNKGNNLEKEDFFEIYDLIETQSRFQLSQLRSKNEAARKDIVKKAFFDNDISGADLAKARSAYIAAIQTSLMQEIELYKTAQESMLKIVKVNENIWNSSMDEYLPGGQEYILNALRYSLSSPFAYTGPHSDDQVFLIFKKGIEMALALITKGNASPEEPSQGNFKNLLIKEMGSEDEQDQLLVLDYLLVDLVNFQEGMNSTDLKSAISAYSLTDTQEMNNLFGLVATEILKK